MGGIIVIDFIDMHTAEHRQRLYEHLKKEMQLSRTKHKVLPPSKFGLVQITRQRVRPERVIKTNEENPNKNGEVEAPIILIERIENQLEKLIGKNDNAKGITLHAHPFVASYLQKGFPSIQNKWFLNYKKWIKILPRDAYQYLEYRFYTASDKVIK